MTVDPLAQALAGLSSSALRRRRDPWADRQAYANALMKQGASGAPVGSIWEGLARAGTGIAGGAFGGLYERQEKDQEAEKSKKLVSALQGTSSPDGVKTPATVDSILGAVGDDPDLRDLVVRLKVGDIMDQRQRAQSADLYKTMRGTPGDAPAGQGGPAVAGGPINPNNMGNIRDMQAGGFRQYGAPEEGVAATIKNVQAYPQAFNGGQPMTLMQIGARWAPKGDGANDPVKWAQNVAGASGLPPDQPLDMSNPQIAMAFARGVHVAEKGAPAAFPPEVYAKGVQMAFGGQGPPQGQIPPAQTAGVTAPNMPGQMPGQMPPDIGSITGPSQSSMPPVGGPPAMAPPVPPPGPPSGLPPGAPPTPVPLPPPTIPMGGPQVPMTADQIPVQPGTPSGAPLMGQPAAPPPVAPPAALPPGLGAQLGGQAGDMVGRATMPAGRQTPVADVSLGPNGQLVIGGQPGPAGAPPPAPAPMAPPPAQGPVASPAAPPQPTAEPYRFQPTRNVAAEEAQRLYAQADALARGNAREAAMAPEVLMKAQDADRRAREHENAEMIRRQTETRQATADTQKAADERRKEARESGNAPLAAEFSKYRDAKAEAATMLGLLKDYRDRIGAAGTGARLGATLGMGSEGPKLASSYYSAMLLAKGEQLFNLGVLNGPDLEVIRKTIADPTKGYNMIRSGESIQGQVDIVTNLITRKLAEKEKALGISPSAPVGAAPPATAAPPAAGSGPWDKYK